MHRGIRHRIPPNELVLFIDIDMIFVAIVTHTMLDGPPRLRIFLPGFGGMGLLCGGGLAGFNGCIPSVHGLYRQRVPASGSHCVLETGALVGP